MAQLNFQVSGQYQPLAALDPIPAGWYQAQISRSEIKPTKDNSGQGYVELEFTILAPQEFAGRKVYTNLNIYNNNPVASEIAYRALTSICYCIGVLSIQDTQQLHGKPLQIKVTVSGQRQDPTTGATYEPRNEIKGYRDVNGNDPGKAGGPSYPSGQAAGPPAAAPSWVQNGPAPMAGGPQQPQYPQQPMQAPAAPAGWAPPAQQWAPPGGAPAPQPGPAAFTPQNPGAPAAAPWSPTAGAPPGTAPPFAGQPAPITGPAPGATPPWARQ